MSTLSAVRKYLVDRITEEDSSFKELDHPFVDDHVGRSQILRSYHISYSLGSNQSEDGCLLIENGSGQAVLHFTGKVTNGQSILDNALDTAHNIKMRIANPKKWNVSGIKRVQVTGLDSERLGNNNNIVRVSLDFEFTLASKVI